MLLSQIPPRFTRPLQALDLFPPSHLDHDGNKSNDDDGHGSYGHKMSNSLQNILPLQKQKIMDLVAYKFDEN